MDVVTVVVVVHSLVVVELVVVLVVVVWIVVVVAFSWKVRAKAMTTITPNRKRPTRIPIANLALSESDMMMTCRLQLKDQLTFKVMHCFLHVVHDQRFVHILKSIVSFIKINEFHSFDVTFIFFRNFGEFDFCVVITLMTFPSQRTGSFFAIHTLYLRLPPAGLGASERRLGLVRLGNVRLLKSFIS